LSVKSNSNQNASSPKASWIGNHPSVTFISTQRSAAFWLLPSNPHFCIPREICYYQGRFFATNPRTASKLLSFASLKEVETSSNQERLRRIPSSSVLLTVFALFFTRMKQDDRGIQTAFGGRDVRNTFITIFPKCFRERQSLSSGGMKGR
jgi:hypothetical protein